MDLGWKKKLIYYLIGSKVYKKKNYQVFSDNVKRIDNKLLNTFYRMDILPLLYEELKNNRLNQKLQNEINLLAEMI